MNAGKGDKYRPVNKKKFDSNFNNINWSKWYVYLVECADGSLYCGITNDLDKRIESHNKGDGAKYTASRRPVKLVYSEKFDNRSLASKREAQIKNLSRENKLCMISGYNHQESLNMEKGTG